MVLEEWQVQNAHHRPVRLAVVDSPTGVEVGVGREVASPLPPTPAVRCRGSISRRTQVSSVRFCVGTRSCHFQQCRRLSLPYKGGQAMCRKSHEKSGPTGKALVQAEMTRQDTEHNTVRPVPQPSGAFGHILRPVLQHVEHEIHTTQGAHVYKAFYIASDTILES